MNNLIRLILILSLSSLAQESLQAENQNNCDQIEARIKATDPKAGKGKLGLLYQSLGDCFYDKGEKVKATAAYEKALAAPYTSVPTDKRLAIVKKLLAMGRKELAQAELQKILLHEPNSSEAKALLTSPEQNNKENGATPTPISLSGSCQDFLEKIKNAEREGRKGRLGYLYKQLGDCYVETNNQKEAITAYTKALSYPYDALYSKARLEIAEYLGYNGDLEKGIDVTKGILDREPNNQQALSLMSTFLSWSGDYKQSNRYAERVLVDNPRDKQANLAKANSLAWSGHYKEAIPLYQLLLTQSDLNQKERFEVEHGLALSYFKTGQDTLAKKTIDFLQPSSPFQQEKKEKLSRAIAHPHTEPALSTTALPPTSLTSAPEHTQKIREEKTSKKEVLCEKYLKQIEEALKAKDRSKMSLLYKELGDCYIHNRQKEPAAEAYITAFSYPNGSLSIIDRIEMAEFLGNFDKYNIAIEQLRLVLRDDPDNTSAQILLGRFLVWRNCEGDLEDAERSIETALIKEPKNRMALLTKCHILIATHRAEFAVPILNDLLSKEIVLNQEESFEGRYLLGLAYLELHQLIAAESNAQFLKPEFASQETKRERLLAKIEKAKCTHPLAGEIEEMIKERIDFGRSMLQKRCFGPAYFEAYQALRLDPNHVGAHLLFAQILFADDNYFAALERLDVVLCKDPRNLEALILQANVLRRLRDFPGSSCAFNRALCIDGDNFDARVGMAWLYLAMGNPVFAECLARGTAVVKDWEISEMNTLCWDINTGPTLRFDYWRYQDSDNLNTDDYRVQATFYKCDWRFDIFYHHVYALQPVILEQDIDVIQRADGGGLNAIRFISPWLDVGGGIGYTQTTQGDFVTGNLIANIRTRNGNFEVGSVYDVFTYTAAAIFFEIRTLANYVHYSKVLSGRWIVGGDYIFTYFTDSNHSNDLRFWAEYKLLDCVCWFIFADYRFRYLDFKDQPLSPFLVPGVFGGHGYFDPFNFFGNEVGISFLMETKKIDIHIRPYLSYVTYENFGRHNGVVIAGKALGTYFFTKNASVYFGVEAGRWPLRQLKYNYTILSTGLDWSF